MISEEKTGKKISPEFQRKGKDRIPFLSFPFLPMYDYFTFIRSICCIFLLHVYSRPSRGAVYGPQNVRSPDGGQPRNEHSRRW